MLNNRIIKNHQNMKTKFYSACLLLFLTCVQPAAAQANKFNEFNPVANPEAVVTDNGVRFTILTPQLIRMEWSDSNKFVDNASFVFINRNLPVPKFTTDRENGWLVIETEYLLLRYKINSGEFTGNNLSVDFSKSFSADKGKYIWHPGMKDTANLFGTIRTLDAINGAAPLDPGILSKDGWTLIDDSERPLFDNSDWPWVLPADSSKKQDYYFFGYGHNYKQQLLDFTKTAGKIPLPPKFAFGTWWSKYWNYTDEELRDLVEQFNTFRVPLNVLVVDMDWHKTFQEKWDWGKLDQAGATTGWTGYSWNKNYFPDPDAFLKWTESEGLKVTLNLHPASGIQPYEDKYEEMAGAMGVDPASQKYIPFDITNKKFAKNYFDVIIHPLEKSGVDFWWLDWQQWHTTSIPGVTPTWWINYVFFTDMERQGKRPLLFHRWGGPGNHRYQIGFSGDAHSTWESLAFQPYFTATAGNVGFGYWSHDIGGHMPGAVTAELFTRWVQFGAFSPVLRTHSTKNPLAERRIWGYPFQYFKIMRDTYLLRYSLIPYIYSAAREAYDTGISLCRPMYYDYPDKEEAYNYPGQYMFGNDIITAPIASPVDTISLQAEKEIWLPEGTWYEWFTGTMLKGPAAVKRSFLLNEIPVYIKAGAVIPRQASLNAEDNADTLLLSIFPGNSGSANIYDDAGNSPAYKTGEFTTTTVKHFKKGTEQVIRVSPVKGSYPGMPKTRSYIITLEGSLPPRQITYNNRQLEWEYNGDELSVTFSIPAAGITDSLEITVSHSSEELFTLTNGFRGKLSRLKEVKNILASGWPGVWNLGELVSAAQTGRRIGLNYKSAETELKQFDRKIDELKSRLGSLDLPEADKKYLLLPIQ
jgi:alpha-glucosidase (family GH31 glycosyl hydrolase)